MVVSAVLLVGLTVISIVLYKILAELRKINTSFVELKSSAPIIFSKIEDLIEKVVAVLPINTDDRPVDEMMREVYRRKLIINEWMTTLVDVIAVGVSKAFRKR